MITQIGKHWAANSTPEMTTEKLQNLASSTIEGFEKVKIFQLWNSSKELKKLNKFPIGPFNDASFNVFLHKYVFWSQLIKAALVLYKPMVEKSYRTGKLPGMGFASYIESKQIRQWNYAFNGPISQKEIMKSLEWSKQSHGELACSRLVYRCKKILPHHLSISSLIDINCQKLTCDFF
jgi:hypothetical protein